jgi:hypothetical protein
VLEGRAFEAWYQPGLCAPAQAAADPLWQLHGQLSQALLAADPPRLREAPGLGPEGLEELEQIEEQVCRMSLAGCACACLCCCSGACILQARAKPGIGWLLCKQHRLPPCTGASQSFC